MSTIWQKILFLTWPLDLLQMAQLRCLLCCGPYWLHSLRCGLSRFWLSLWVVLESSFHWGGPAESQTPALYCFCWSHHHCFPQGFVEVWFCFASLCWHWAFLSTAAARLRTLDRGLVEERGRGNKSRVCLPLFFPPPFWEAVWMLQGCMVGDACAECVGKRDTGGFQPLCSSASSSLCNLCLSSWQCFDDSPRELMN